MSKRGTETNGVRREHGRDQRCDQLMALAEGGDEDAVGDLWREYGMEYRREGGRDAD